MAGDYRGSIIGGVLEAFGMAETHERLVGRLAATLASLHGVEPIASRLCEGGRQMLGADGAALTIVTEASRMLVAATDDLAGRLDDLQEVVGEGPGHDARRDRTVRVANLADHDDPRWPLLREQATTVGFGGAIIAVPLLPDVEPIGTLTAHRPGPPFEVDSQTATFLGVAIGTALLQDPQLARQDEIYAEAWASRAQIHQATGMVVSQVGVRPEDALALLRGQAFVQGSPLLDLAQQIVDRSIDFRHFMIEGD